MFQLQTLFYFNDTFHFNFIFFKLKKIKKIKTEYEYCLIEKFVSFSLLFFMFCTDKFELVTEKDNFRKKI